jgi:hypothetical protein
LIIYNLWRLGKYKLNMIQTWIYYQQLSLVEFEAVVAAIGCSEAAAVLVGYFVVMVDGTVVVAGTVGYFEAEAGTVGYVVVVVGIVGFVEIEATQTVAVADYSL